MSTDFIIEDELKKLPAKPGVYIMRNARDEILYVGKAVSLRSRVRQYFQSRNGKSPKVVRMVSQIDRFEYIVTDSELEALVLENDLIKDLDDSAKESILEVLNVIDEELSLLETQNDI